MILSALLLPFLVASPQEGPLSRLVGKWTSVETVIEPDGSKKNLKLRGTNAWVFEGKLLEIRESFTIEGDPKPHFNHILLRQTAKAEIIGWWHSPDGDQPIQFRGSYTPEGMTLDQVTPGRLRLVYRWDGPDAYDAKLQIKQGEGYVDRTLARYTRAK